jgi:hypothetical protein
MVDYKEVKIDVRRKIILPKIDKEEKKKVSLLGI